MTTRQIVDAAEQRNTSAVTYHFGTRQELLLEILARRGAPVDEARGQLRTVAGEQPDLRSLVACLVRPYVALLDGEGGRSYVRIVAQLRGRFAAWRVESDAATTKHLSAILDDLEARPDATVAVRRERVVALIMVLTGTVAERARRIDDGTGNDLSDQEFVDNLIDVCAAVVAA